MVNTAITIVISLLYILCKDSKAWTVFDQVPDDSKQVHQATLYEHVHVAGSGVKTWTAEPSTTLEMFSQAGSIL